MIMDRIRSLVRSREADDRAALLRVAHALGAGGKAAGKIDAAEVDALLRRLGRTPDDLDGLVDLARQHADAQAAAAGFDKLHAAASDAMSKLKAVGAARLAALAEHGERLAAAERDLAEAELQMRAAAEARTALRDLDRRLRLAIGVDADVERRIVRLPGEIENARAAGDLLTRNLAQARARLATAELALKCNPGGGALVAAAVTGGRDEVERLERELAALPARVEAMENELREMQQAVTL